MILQLGKFEMTKLLKSPVFLSVLALPVFYFMVILVQFKWNFDQSDLSHKHFIYEGASYSNSNPYYHFSAHMISGFYLLIIPIQSILGYGLNTQLDYKDNGRMLIRSLKFSQWKRRACSFTVSSLLIMLSWVIPLILLVICLNYLPDILSQLEFGQTYSPWKQISYHFLSCMMISIPMLLLHFWISRVFRKISTGIVIVVLLLLVTYSVYNATPYYLISKWMADGLYAIQYGLILGKNNMVMSVGIWSWTEIASVSVMVTFCVLHAAFKKSRH